MRSDNPARGFSFLIADTPEPSPTRPQRPTRDGLDLDLSDMGASPSALAQGTNAPVRTPTLLDSAPPPLVRAAAEAELRSRNAAELVPTIKKIAFPARPKKVGPSPPPRTRFVEGGFRAGASGESSVPPPVIALPAGSEAELARTIVQTSLPRGSTGQTKGAQDDTGGAVSVTGTQTSRDQATGAAASPVCSEESDPFALPEDLPQTDGDQIRASWGSDTPTAKELWIQARGGLLQAGHLARDASRRTWAKSQSAATVLSAALRQRLLTANSNADESVLGEGGRQAEGGTESNAGAARSAPRASERSPDSLGPSPGSPRRDSSAPLPHSGLPGVASADSGRQPRTWVLRRARSVAAPLAACAAALVVYQTGSHFLGSAGTAGLSKGVPQVPDLGQLDPQTIAAPNGAELASTRDPSADRSPKQATAPAMQVEQTKMPEGLSWPGKGLIEVVTAEDELIYVDGVFTGRGPLRRIPVTPGDHEISIKKNGSERTGAVAVELGRCARAIFANAP